MLREVEEAFEESDGRLAAFLSAAAAAELQEGKGGSASAGSTADCLLARKSVGRYGSSAAFDLGPPPRRELKTSSE